jgi:CBS domain
MSIKASRVMTTRVATASPGDSVVEIAKCLEDHGIHAMPVCEVSGELVGMISERSSRLIRPRPPHGPFLVVTSAAGRLHPDEKSRMLRQPRQSGARFNVACGSR